MPLKINTDLGAELLINNILMFDITLLLNLL